MFNSIGAARFNEFNHICCPCPGDISRKHECKNLETVGTGA